MVDPPLPARRSRGLGPGAGPGRPAVGREVVAFRYGGRTALTVRGSATGRRYRFPGPGAIVLVDARDRASVAAVPNLSQVPLSGPRG